MASSINHCHPSRRRAIPCPSKSKPHTLPYMKPPQTQHTATMPRSGDGKAGSGCTVLAGQEEGRKEKKRDQKEQEEALPPSQVPQPTAPTPVAAAAVVVAAVAAAAPARTPPRASFRSSGMRQQKTTPNEKTAAVAVVAAVAVAPTGAPQQ